MALPKVKMTRKGNHLQSDQDIGAAATLQLKTLMKADLQRCCRKWQEGWEKHAQSEGDVLIRIKGSASFTIIHFLKIQSFIFVDHAFSMKFISNDSNVTSSKSKTMV